MSIKISKLCFSYNDKKIIDNLDLVINEGDKIGIIGRSGEGKTTLLKLLSGLYEPTSGEISMYGVSNYIKRREYIALVMQNKALFPASIKENITCGHEINEQSIYKACAIAQLTDWLNTLPKGIDTFVGEAGSKVSGGQAQRIVIARAILKNAPILLLDEPTSALDNETITKLLKDIEILLVNKTIIQVSHNYKSLVNCNKIYELKGGKLYDKRID